METPNNSGTLKKVGLAMVAVGLGLSAWLGFERFGGGQSGGGGVPFGLLAGIVIALLGVALMKGSAGAPVSVRSGSQTVLNVERLDAALAAELYTMIERGEKVAAIKRCREATGMGLAESKAIVDELARIGAESKRAA